MRRQEEEQYQQSWASDMAQLLHDAKHEVAACADNQTALAPTRMMKVEQRISGTFRTQRGADIFCAIRAYISTVRKQGYSVISALHHALLGQPFTLPD